MPNFIRGTLAAVALSLPVMPAAAQTETDGFEGARSAVAESLSRADWVRTALDGADAEGATYRFLDAEGGAIASVVSKDGSRAGILVGEGAHRTRLRPGLYTMEGGERPKAALDGREIELIDIPAWQVHTGASAAVIGSVDWLCEGFPDNGSPGLNFCETLVLCHAADLFCGGF